MTSPRSMFTEAIEDHLALKKQNASLNASMPLTRFDAGDPLDRFPGGPVRPAPDAEESLAVGVGAPMSNPDELPAGATATAMAAANAHAAAADPVGSSLADGEYRRPLEPLNGMTPMLSLVRDVDEDDAEFSSDALAGATAVLPSQEHSAPVLRFPGGVGPREETEIDEAAAAHAGGVATLADEEHVDDAAETGEQPIIVIDADEPLAPLSPDGPPLGSARSRQAAADRTKGPRFFGLGRKRRSKKDDADGDGWFAEKPRDFSWDD